MGGKSSGWKGNESGEAESPIRIKLMRLAFSPSTDTADNFVWLDVAHDFRRNVWLSKHANLVLRNDLHPMKKSI